ncbi:hypothetical protein [uncultured Roseobacter sp.]|uniref:hypothetical protein n=1 Tax=uncultured Roseobacter sp. TaxID=114847 RepID=UPI00261A3BEB|nr:hypothetical protein [uncultured Roseobacter sp.]
MIEASTSGFYIVRPATFVRFCNDQYRRRVGEICSMGARAVNSGICEFSDFKTEHRLLQWPFIKAFAGSEFVKFAAAIPVFGYLILFNDSVLGSLSFSQIAGSHSSEEDPFWLSSVTKLRLAFFGGIFMLVASSLQAWRAPLALSISSNDFEFSE